MSDQFSLDDLPRFSPWPARLLGAEPWKQKERTMAENVREYEQDKWGALCRQAASLPDPLHLEDVNRLLEDYDTPLLCSEGDLLRLIPNTQVREKSRAIAAETLRRLLPAPYIAELGAGYGDVIIGAAKLLETGWDKLVGAEYTASGTELIDRIGRGEGLEMEATRCDFTAARIVDAELPPGGVVMTHMAIVCIPRSGRELIDRFLALEPSFVVHIEPMYAHCPPDSLLGLLRRRYIEVNDYNTDLLPSLLEARDEGRIEILEERPHVFGTNPLLSSSVVIWRPASK